MIAPERLEALAVPARVAEVVLSAGFERRATLGRVERAVVRGALVVLAGPPGAGKSVAAAYAAANARSPGSIAVVVMPAEPGDPGAFLGIDGTHYVRRDVAVGARLLPGAWLAAATAHDSLFNEAYWTRARTVDVLVVDDLGLEVQGERVRDRLVGLFVERFDNERATIATTNVDLPTFKRTYTSGAGERLVRRLEWIETSGVRL